MHTCERRPRRQSRVRGDDKNKQTNIDRSEAVERAHLAKQLERAEEIWKRAVVVHDHPRHVIHLYPARYPSHAHASRLRVREHDHFVSSSAQSRRQGVNVQFDPTDGWEEEIAEHQHALPPTRSARDVVVVVAHDAR